MRFEDKDGGEDIIKVSNIEERKTDIMTVIESRFYKDFFTKEQEEALLKIRNESLERVGKMFMSNNTATPSEEDTYHYLFLGEQNIITAQTNNVFNVAPLKTPIDWEEYKDIKWFKNVFVPNIEIIYRDGKFLINGKIKEFKFLETQLKIFDNIIESYKERAKNLFVALAKESYKGGLYRIEYKNGMLTTYQEKNCSECNYITPYFYSVEKANEMIKKYRDELLWYITKYQHKITILVRFMD